MSNAREDRDWLQHNNRKKKNTESVFSPNEEIGEMHFSTENYSTAIEYFTKALDSQDLKDYPHRFRIYLRIGDSYKRKGNYKEATEHLERAKSFLSDTTPPEAIAKVAYRKAYILLAEGDFDEALRLAFSAYRSLKHSSEHKDVADIQLLLANCYYRKGLSGEAEDFLMDALSSYRRIEDRVGIANVYNDLGLLHKNACRWNRALASLSKSYELAKSLGLSQQLFRVQLNLGVVYAKLRRFADALSSFSNAATMAERFGDQYKLTKAILMQGRTFVQCGEYCKAEKYILRAQAMANEHRYGREAALADEYLGELMIARGKYEEALVNLSKGLRKARRIAPEGDVTAEILRRTADVYYEMNMVDKSLAMIDEGLEISDRCGENYEIGFYYRTQGLCHKRQGNHSEAFESLKKSVETFDKFGNPYEKLCSQQILARQYLRVRTQESMLKAKQLLSDSIVGFGKLEESKNQMLSQVLLAVVEERLGNLDDALLAVYEADRLAEEEQSSKFRKLLQAMRTRVEESMARDTKLVLEQIPMFGSIQTGSRSRDKLVTGLTSSLKLIVSKMHAQGGFVAIPREKGKAPAVACREEMSQADAKAILAWYKKRRESSDGHHALMITAPDRDSDLDTVLADTNVGSLVFQELGFEDESLGVIVVHQEKAGQNPFGQEALDFLATYSRLISLSVYELIRIERRQTHAKPAARGFERIVTENNDMIKLLNLSERVAHSNATVLLQGETGTGKGLIAYAVHLLSDRRDKPFVHINCAAMPESLLESELFGHAKGAFTGAIAEKQGLLREARGGTIFLDEIGKTTLAMQGKLLQFLDSGKVRKVGSNDLTSVDVRVICASKADLLSLCDEGRFLEDFFYRINDFPLTVPPLRDRKEDIPLLFFHYLRKCTREMGKTITDISDRALEVLREYAWPGNVRELEKSVKRSVILADDGETLDVHHLPQEMILAPRNRNGAETHNLKSQIERLEKREIQAALERNRGNKSQTAIELGISYPNLLSKIKRYNLPTY